MLSRGARQKNALFHIRHPKGLATHRLHSHSTRPTPIVHPRRNEQRERHRQAAFQANRNLATAADQASVDKGSYATFEELPYPAGGEYKSGHQWDTLFPGLGADFDPSSLVIMDDFLQTRPKVVRQFNRRNATDEEMLANLDISLKVGQYDRAASIISRLGTYFPAGSPEYLAVHNRYLESLVSHMIMTRQHQLVWSVHRFLEVDMRNANVEPDGTTLAIMVKMALRMLHGGKRDRTVRRYWQMAKNKELEEQLLIVPVLSALELGELSEVGPFQKIQGSRRC